MRSNTGNSNQINTVVQSTKPLSSNTYTSNYTTSNTNNTNSINTSTNNTMNNSNTTINNNNNNNTNITKNSNTTNNNINSFNKSPTIQMNQRKGFLNQKKEINHSPNPQPSTTIESPSPEPTNQTLQTQTEKSQSPTPVNSKRVGFGIVKPTAKTKGKQVLGVGKDTSKESKEGKSTSSQPNKLFMQKKKKKENVEEVLFTQYNKHMKSSNNVNMNKKRRYMTWQVKDGKHNFGTPDVIYPTIGCYSMSEMMRDNEVDKIEEFDFEFEPMKPIRDKPIQAKLISTEVAVFVMKK